MGSHAVLALLTLLAAAAVFYAAKVSYNLFFHPLARVPGPPWAAATRLWLFFQEMTGHGHENLLALHHRYGPIMRIAPNELSVNDIDVYHKVIYAQNTKFPKAPYFYDAFNQPGGSLFSETNSQFHQQEKRLMSHAFSRANILGLQGAIYTTMNTWIAQIRNFVEQNKPIPLWHATQCLTLENASRFSYGSSDGALETVDFHHPYFEPMEQFSPFIIVFQQFLFLRQVAMLAQRWNPSGFPQLNKGASDGFLRLKDHKAEGQKDGMVMFESMLERARSVGREVDPERMVANGGLMLVAGTGTTAAALTTAVYHMVKQPELWKRLQAALSSALGSNKQPDITELEKIPLLEACAKEALRLSVPIRGRHPRVVPAGGWEYRRYSIPQGTIVGAAPIFHCYDPDVFPDPTLYKPKRWLVADTTRLQYFLLAFSHGSRSCIGQNLALVSLRLGLAQVVMNFDPVSVMDDGLTFVEYGGLTIPQGGLVSLKPAQDS